MDQVELSDHEIAYLKGSVWALMVFTAGVVLAICFFVGVDEIKMFWYTVGISALVATARETYIERLLGVNNDTENGSIITDERQELIDTGGILFDVPVFERMVDGIIYDGDDTHIFTMRKPDSCATYLWSFFISRKTNKQYTVCWKLGSSVDGHRYRSRHYRSLSPPGNVLEDLSTLKATKYAFESLLIEPTDSADFIFNKVGIKAMEYYNTKVTSTQ